MSTERDQVKERVRRVFVNRTHKFWHVRRFTVDQTDGVRAKRYRTIVASYEPTVDKLVDIVKSHAEEAVTRELVNEHVRLAKAIRLGMDIDEWSVHRLEALTKEES
jgi:hypothetical protein